MHERFDRLQTSADGNPASIVFIVHDKTVESWFLKGPFQNDKVAQTAVKMQQFEKEQLLVIINNFLILHEASRVCIFTSSSGTCHLVFMTPSVFGNSTT